MIRARFFCIALLVTLITAGTALASWYDDYDAGLTAVRKGQWSVAVQKMTAAINAHDKEGNAERAYGALFYNYHPHYYRGVAYLNLGKYEQAITDFEKTSGAGEVDLGSLDTLMGRAKTKLAAASAPPTQEPTTTVAQQPPPRQVPVTPVQVAPATPSIDPALRGRVSAAIQKANTSLAGARSRRAGSSPQYGQAIQSLTEANTKLATAKNNDELNAALAAAENSALLADSAVAPGALPPPVRTATVTPRVVAATEAAMADYKSTLRVALNNYFAGEFESAARGFEQLSRTMPNNGWIWAFLGASQYSQYAFEADETYKKAAIASFTKAKKTRSFKNGLPERYFSRRIRKFFETVGG
jgi:tetratricopeptide (TPR) repeat protein